MTALMFVSPMFASSLTLAAVSVPILALVLAGWRDRRTLGLLVALLLAAVGPDVPTKICSWCWWCVECWF